jgi:hypothetical protein
MSPQRERVGEIRSSGAAAAVDSAASPADGAAVDAADGAEVEWQRQTAVLEIHSQVIEFAEQHHDALAQQDAAVAAAMNGRVAGAEAPTQSEVNEGASAEAAQTTVDLTAPLQQPTSASSGTFSAAATADVLGPRCAPLERHSRLGEAPAAAASAPSDPAADAAASATAASGDDDDSEAPPAAVGAPAGAQGGDDNAATTQAHIIEMERPQKEGSDSTVAAGSFFDCVSPDSPTRSEVATLPALADALFAVRRMPPESDVAAAPTAAVRTALADAISATVPHRAGDVFGARTVASAPPSDSLGGSGIMQSQQQRPLPQRAAAGMRRSRSGDRASAVHDAGVNDDAGAHVSAAVERVEAQRARHAGAPPAARAPLAVAVAAAADGCVSEESRDRALASLGPGEPITDDVLNVILQALCMGKQRAGAVSTRWSDAAMPEPHAKQPKCSKAPPKSLVLIPIRFDDHCVLFVADRSHGVLEVYDSMPTFDPWTRDQIVTNLLKLACDFGLPQLVGRQSVLMDCEEQAPGCKDCGLHVIRNAARRLGYANWQLTRPDVERLLLAQWRASLE